MLRQGKAARAMLARIVRAGIVNESLLLEGLRGVLAVGVYLASRGL